MSVSGKLLLLGFLIRILFFVGLEEGMLGSDSFSKNSDTGSV